MLQCTWTILSPSCFCSSVSSLLSACCVQCGMYFRIYCSFKVLSGYLTMLLCSWSLCCCSSWAWSLKASCSSSDCWLRPSISHCSLRDFFCQKNTPTYRNHSFSFQQCLEFYTCILSHVYVMSFLLPLSLNANLFPKTLHNSWPHHSPPLPRLLKFLSFIKNNTSVHCKGRVPQFEWSY